MFKNLKKEFKVVGPLYIIEALSGLAEIHGPLWVIYFLAIGVSPSQIGLLFLAWTIMGFIFEVPTGAIADHFGRKPVLTVSFLISGALLVLVAFTYSFTTLLLLFAFFGIAESMELAAMNAWTIDALKYGKGEKFIHKCLSRRRSFLVLFMIPAFLLNSAIISYGEYGLVSMMKYIWILSGSFFFLGGIVAFFFKESYFRRKKLRLLDSVKKTYKLSKDGLRHTLKNPMLFKFILGHGFFLYAMLVFALAWQPFFKDFLTLAPVYFGVLLAVGAFISFIVLNAAPKLLKQVKVERNAVLFLFTICCLALLFFAFGLSSVSTVLMFYIILLINDLADPLLVHWFNKHVPSRTRATTMSVWNMSRWVFSSIALYAGFGLFTEWFGLKSALYIAVVALLVSVFIYSRIKTK